MCPHNVHYQVHESPRLVLTLINPMITFSPFPLRTILLLTHVQCFMQGAVGIANRYGLDGAGIESWWQRDLPHPSRQALRPNPASCIIGKSKGKGHPATGRGGARGTRQIKAPDFLDVWHYKGGRSSAIRTGRLYPHEKSLVLESTSGHMVASGQTRKNSTVTPPGIDPGTVRLVAQCLNHYATTPGDLYNRYRVLFPGVKQPGSGVNHPLIQLQE